MEIELTTLSSSIVVVASIMVLLWTLRFQHFYSTMTKLIAVGIVAYAGIKFISHDASIPVFHSLSDDLFIVLAMLANAMNWKEEK